MDERFVERMTEWGRELRRRLGEIDDRVQEIDASSVRVSLSLRPQRFR